MKYIIDFLKVQNKFWITLLLQFSSARIQARYQAVALPIDTFSAITM